MADDRINIKTLSRLIGVAPSTVSRVLSGKARQCRIAAETEARVMEKARELGFRPNYFAHSLNTGKTFNIGLVMANKIDAFLGTIIEGVESRLRNTEYQMVLATCENNLELEQAELSRMLYRQVDGIIIYPSAPAEDNTVQQYYLKNIVEQNIPMVIIGRDEHINVDKVLFADYEAGKNAALAFLAKGCRCFGAVTMPECSSLDKQRIRGYVETLFQHGVKPESIIETTTNGTANEAAARRLMPVDCLWGINTGLILNIVNTMSRFQDVTMLQLRGLGTEPFLDLLPFHITMQPMPSRQMGETAAALLLEQIGSGDKLPPRTVILPWPDLPV